MRKGKQSNGKGSGASNAGNGSAAAATVMAPVTTNTRVVVRCAKCNRPVVVDKDASGLGRATVDLSNVALNGKPVMVMDMSDEILLKVSSQPPAISRYAPESFTALPCPQCETSIPVVSEEKEAVRLRPSSQAAAVASSASS